ncbi:hypothetical protein Pmani_017041 [Petrolisthes manimaculis]|uniref:Major facilitator superfamily (MFS) profile domain-containing protein n=1 Tax=Petrolisthes manimaculis TaxID=1843537 RepID=A0AAE1U668_9EUCA|nr:hypothetical protein Pmani_017041 [Petrolisthes manimaculis]
MYNYNYTEVVDMGYEAAIVNKSSLTILSPNPVKCLHRDFNYSQYQSTVVTEWDLVCERRALYSTTQSVLMMGDMLGTLIMGWLIDLVGRRAVARVSSLFYFLTAILVIGSPGVTLYIIMKAITAAMDSGLYLSVFIILMETSATRHRAAMGTLFVIPWALGYMLVPGIAYILKENWRWLQLAYSLPTTLFIVYFIWLPESPRWLITQSRFQEALKILKWTAKVNNKTLPPDNVILDAMTYTEKQNLERSEKQEEEPKERCSEKCEEENEAKEKICQRSGEEDGEELKESYDSRVMKVMRHFFILLLNPHLRLRTLVIFFGFFSASMVYYGVSLNATNLGTDPYLYVFLGGLLEIPSYLLMWPMMVFVGRKKSLAVLYFTCAACIFSVMALMLIQPNGKLIQPQGQILLYGPRNESSISRGRTQRYEGKSGHITVEDKTDYKANKEFKEAVWEQLEDFRIEEEEKSL